MTRRPTRTPHLEEFRGTITDPGSNLSNAERAQAMRLFAKRTGSDQPETRRRRIAPITVISQVRQLSRR